MLPALRSAHEPMAHRYYNLDRGTCGMDSLGSLECSMLELKDFPLDTELNVFIGDHVVLVFIDDKASEGVRIEANVWVSVEKVFAAGTGFEGLVEHNPPCFPLEQESMVAFGLKHIRKVVSPEQWANGNRDDLAR